MASEPETPEIHRRRLTKEFARTLAALVTDQNLPWPTSESRRVWARRSLETDCTDGAWMAMSGGSYLARMD